MADEGMSTTEPPSVGQAGPTEPAEEPTNDTEEQNEDNAEASAEEVVDEMPVPPDDVASQKSFISDYLDDTPKSAFRAGETRYLIDMLWLKKLKKYIGIGAWEKNPYGSKTVKPGPIDNSGLLEAVPEGNDDPEKPRILKKQLVDELDYKDFPKQAYKALAAWYGVTEGQAPIIRKVIENGVFVKQKRLEVYLLELKLSLYSDPKTKITCEFSRADTLGSIEEKARTKFSLAADKEVRLWTKYRKEKEDILKLKETTLLDAGIYTGQEIIVEAKNEEGIWPKDFVILEQLRSGGPDDKEGKEDEEEKEEEEKKPEADN